MFSQQPKTSTMSKQDDNYLCLHARSVSRAYCLPHWNMGYLFIGPKVMAYLNTGNFGSDPIPTILTHFLGYTKSRPPGGSVLNMVSETESMGRLLISHSYVINRKKAVATFCSYNQCTVIRYLTEPEPCDEEISSNKDECSFMEGHFDALTGCRNTLPSVLPTKG